MLAKVGAARRLRPINMAATRRSCLARWLSLAGGSESNDHSHDAGDVWPSILLGVVTGLLWAPCAGPVLILIGAALEGATK